MLQLFMTYVLKSIRIRPVMFGVLSYIFGISIPVYLGQQIDWQAFTGGLLFVLLLMIGVMILSAFYQTYFVSKYSPSPSTLMVDLELSDLRQVRTMSLTLALALITAAAVIVAILIANQNLNSAAAVMLFFASAIAVISGLPAFQVKISGYSNIIEVLFVAVLIPAVGFFLQVDQYHRLLGLLSFPLMMFYLAMLLALSMKNYPKDDLAYGKPLIRVIGWQNSVTLHNLCILVGYLWIAALVLIQIPMALVFPQLLTLPLGLAQVFLVTRLSQGAKPQWQFMNLIAFAIYGLTTYFLSFSLWIN